MLGWLVVLVGLASTPALAGRRAEAAQDAYLRHACTLGRSPADLRIRTGILPRRTVPEVPPLDAHPRVTITYTTDRLEIDGLPVRASALSAALAQALARHEQPDLVLLLSADLPASAWTVAWREAREAPVRRRWLAVEVEPSSRPEAPAPQVVKDLVEGRAAIRERVSDPFSRLAALEELTAQAGDPLGRCPVLRASLRTPLGPGEDCEARLASARAVLAACALDETERARAVTALGQAWLPEDRATVSLLPLGAEPPDASSPLGEALPSAPDDD